MERVLIKVSIQPNDTPETLKLKAKRIFETYLKKQITGVSWVEIRENEFVMFKIFFL